jgi:hypothetical protein
VLSLLSAGGDAGRAVERRMAEPGAPTARAAYLTGS